MTNLIGNWPVIAIRRTRAEIIRRRECCNCGRRVTTREPRRARQIAEARERLARK